MTPLRELRMAFVLARREMRSGVRGFGVFLACLALGVGAIAAVGTFSAAVQDGLAADARAILGGDLQLMRTHVELDPGVRDALRAEGAVSRHVRMRTMARPVGEGLPALTEIKAVDGAYPLYGAVELASGAALSEAFATRGGVPGAVAEREFFERMDLEVGDEVTVGEGTFVLTDVIRREPDRVAQFWALGPRLMISLDDLSATGLLRPGVLLRNVYNLRMAGGGTADAAGELAERLQADFPDGGFRTRTFTNAASRLTWLLDDVTMYLTLVGLATLLVGGIGVAGAVRSFLAGRERSIAVMKSLGASRRMVTATYLTQTMLLALAGSTAGALAGLGLAWLGAGPLAERIGVPLARGLNVAPALLAVAYGLLTSLAFSLWPLSAAGTVSPARLFRGYTDVGPRRPGAGTALATALVVGALFALLAANAEDRAVALGFAGGALACIVILRGYAALIRRLAARVPRPANPRLRQAVANLHRPGSSTGSVVFSLGLGLTVLVTVSLADGNIRDLIERQTPSTAPSFFFIDIPKNDIAGFEETALAVPGVERLEKQPSIRGRIVLLDGEPARPENVHPDARWALRGDRGLTFADAMPDKVELEQGQWWPEGYDGDPLVCIDARIAEGFGLTLGDTLTVNVLGRRFTARIACTRRIDWTTGGINHTLIMSPGPLEGAPYTWIATAYAERGQETALFRAVTDAFPAVVAISMREVLDNVRLIFRDIGRAVGAAALLTLAAGLLVLAEALRANLRARHYDAVVFKVLGATRRDVTAALVLEFAILGAASAALAALLGTAGAYLFVTQALHGKWVLLPVPLAGIVLGGVAATVALGMLGVRRALSGSAWPVLRNE